MKKRIMALFLTACLLLGTMSVYAVEDRSDGSGTSAAEEKVTQAVAAAAEPEEENLEVDEPSAQDGGVAVQAVTSADLVQNGDFEAKTGWSAISGADAELEVETGAPSTYGVSADGHGSAVCEIAGYAADAAVYQLIDVADNGTLHLQFELSHRGAAYTGATVQVGFIPVSKGATWANMGTYAVTPKVASGGTATVSGTGITTYQGKGWSTITADYTVSSGTTQVYVFFRQLGRSVASGDILDNVSVTQTYHVASVTHGGKTTNYDTLQEAVNAAQSGDTVKLLANTAESGSITTSFAVLDWCGHTVTGSWKIPGGAKVGTIQNTVDNEQNYMKGGVNGRILVTGGTVNEIKGGRYYTASINEALVLSSGGSVEKISGGWFTGKQVAICWYANSAGKTEISGGVFDKGRSAALGAWSGSLTTEKAVVLKDGYFGGNVCKYSKYTLNKQGSFTEETYTVPTDEAGYKTISGNENQYYRVLAEVYVSNAGDDTNGDGTEASPVKTLSKAYSLVNKNGGVIHVMNEVEVSAQQAISVSGKTFVITGTNGSGVAYANAALKATTTLKSSNVYGMFALSNGTVSFDHVKLDSNSYDGRLIRQAGGTVNLNDGAVLTGMNATVSGQGGAIYITDGTLNLNDGAAIEGNAGGSIWVMNAKATVNMNGGAIRKTTASTANSGSGVNITAGTFTMKGGVIEYNTAAEGAGIYQTGGTVNMTGGAIQHNIATSNGGGAYVSGGTFTMEKNAVIDGNIATTYGGGMQVMGGTVNMGGTISNNIASNASGMGIGLAASGTASGSGVVTVIGTISNNGSTAEIDSAALTAMGGTKPAVAWGAGIYYLHGDLTLGDGAVITGNANPNNQGGGVFVHGEFLDANSELKMSGKVIVENNKSSYGTSNAFNSDVALRGGKNITAPIITLIGALTSDSRVGIAQSSNGSNWINSGVIASGAEADAAASAQYFFDDFGETKAAAQDSTNKQNVIWLFNTVARTSNDNGGSWYYYATLAEAVAAVDSDASTVSVVEPLKDITVSATITTESKFTLRSYGDTKTITKSGNITVFQVNAGGDMTLENITLDGNKNASSNAPTSGQLLYVNGGSAALADGATLQNNNGGGNGGAVYVASGSLSMTGGVISGNTATYGAGVYLNSGAFTMTDGSVSDNDGGNKGQGGGVYIHKNATFTMDGAAAQISGNKAQNGGGVYVNGSKFYLENGIISGNSATSTGDSYGGGVSMTSGSTKQQPLFEMTGGTITNNTVVSANTPSTDTHQGGGVYMYDGTFNMSDGVITGNSAKGEGGGVCVKNTKGVINLTDGTISQNTAGTEGGGIYQLAGTLTQSADSTISGNVVTSTAQWQGGGGVRVDGGTATLGGTISNNYAKDGSGVMIGDNATGSGSVTITGKVIDNGTAAKDTAAIPSGVTATNGAGVYYVQGNLTLGDGATITGNTCDGYYGGLVVYGNYVTTAPVFSGGTIVIKDNTAAKSKTASKAEDVVFVNGDKLAIPYIQLKGELKAGSEIGIVRYSDYSTENTLTENAVGTVFATASDTTIAANSVKYFFDDFGQRYPTTATNSTTNTAVDLTWLDAVARTSNDDGKTWTYFGDLDTAFQAVDNDETTKSYVEVLQDLQLSAAAWANRYRNTGSFILRSGTRTGDKTYTLSRASGYTAYILYANSDADMTIENLILDGTKDTAEATDALLLLGYDKNEKTATVTLGEGAVIRNNFNNKTTYCGTIRVRQKGVLNVEDGAKIYGNKAEYGSAIGVEGGTVNINGGEIYGNYSYRYQTAGGGSSENYGGGAIDVWSGGTLNLNGGKIYGNASAQTAGGVVYTNGTTINVQGSSEVYGNVVTNPASFAAAKETNPTANANGYYEKASGYDEINVRWAWSSGTSDPQVNLIGNFTGRIGIHQGLEKDSHAVDSKNTNSVTNPNQGGTQFGANANGYSGAENFFSDVDANLQGEVQDGKLVWKSVGMNFYVSSTGHDTAATSGTRDNPFLTLKYAMERLNTLGSTANSINGNIYIMDNVDSGVTTAGIDATANINTVTVKRDPQVGDVEVTVKFTGTNQYHQMTMQKGSSLITENVTFDASGMKNSSNGFLWLLANSSATLGEGTVVTGFTTPGSNNHGVISPDRNNKVDGVTITLDGAQITDNTVQAGYGAVYINPKDNNKLIIKGDTVVSGNCTSAGKEVNVVLTADSQLRLGSDFIGNVGVTHTGSMTAPADNVKFGLSQSHAISGGIFSCDTDASLSGAVSGDNLIWQKNSAAVYVSVNGSDTTGSGTHASPYKTLLYAYGKVLPNGTIYVMTENVDSVTASDRYVSAAGKYISANKNVTITKDDLASEGTTVSIRHNNGNAPLVLARNAELTTTIRDVDLTSWGVTMKHRGNGDNALIDVRGGTLVIENSAVSGAYNVGTAKGRGSADWSDGTIRVAGGTLKVTDTTIIGNTTNGAIYELGGEVILSGTVNITGNKTTGNVDTNVYLADSTQTLTLDGLNKASQVGVTQKDAAEEVVFASQSSDASAYVVCFTDDTGTYGVGTSGTNRESLIWTLAKTPVAVILVSGTNTSSKEYTTLASAVAAYTNSADQVIQMIANSTESPVTVDKTTYLDLNGKTVNANITVESGCTLYGLDSTTNGYQDLASYGKITGTISGDAAQITKTTTDHFPARAMNYLKVQNADGSTSFHRFNVQVAEYTGKVNFENGTGTLKFRPAFQGDSTVIAQLKQLGAGVKLADAGVFTKGWIVKPDDLTAATGTTAPYYYEADLVNIANTEGVNGFLTQYDLIGCLDFGDLQFDGTNAVRRRSFLEVLCLFYQKADAEDQIQIDGFIADHEELQTAWEELQEKYGEN